jgi:RNA polymerase sigma factor (sigma-70 family)
MATDIELLRRYAEFRDEAAFAALVDRHVSFVYSAALRQLNGATHRAEDVTQTVFIQLAQHAAKLLRSAEILGWLYTATHHAAANLKRAEARRQQREREAHLIHHDARDGLSTPDWERVRPVLDEAILELDEKDRRIILLRFFQQTRFPDLGRIFGLSEDAARMRVERALDKLHQRMSRRGITSTAGALAAALSHQAIVAAPTGLAATVTSAAVANVAATAAAGGAAIGLFTMSTKTVVFSTIAILATSTAVYELNQNRRIAVALGVAELERDHFRTQAQSAQQRAAQADQDLANLQSAVDTARAANAATEAKIAALAKNPPSRIEATPAKATDLLSRLAEPVLPPANLDLRYTPGAVRDEFAQVSQKLGLNVGKLMVDDSEFPFIVYGQVEGNFRDVKAAFDAAPGYRYAGSVSQSHNGSTYFAINITPIETLTDSQDRTAASGRMMARMQILAGKAQSN